MKVSKKVLVPSLAFVAIVVAGTVGASKAGAFGFSGNRGENRESLIQRFIEKFDLNKDDIEGVFENHRNQMQEKRNQRHEEHLSELVSDGKLTEDQKIVLIAKREQDCEEFQNMTREERQAERQAHREEMDQWFEEQGIDHDVLVRQGKGIRGKHGGR
ncbi:MAG: hypothetical protein U9O20_02745 [Patescibacteria group bacterium]|nr:hypothetical protein [Patescibacteria group bacterium]